MKLYREVEASDRPPKERDEVHVIENGRLTTGSYEDGQWYLGEHERAVIKFNGVWFEPVEITEEEIEEIIEENVDHTAFGPGVITGVPYAVKAIMNKLTP